MANTSAIWQQAARTTYQLSSPSCSTRTIQKIPKKISTKKFGEFPGKKVRRMDHQQKLDRTERTRGLGRKMREEIGKGNQMMALRFQTGGLN